MAQRFAKLSSEWSFSGVWLSFSKVFPGLVTPWLCRAWMKTCFSSMLVQKWPWLFSVVIKDSLEIPKIDASYAFVKRKLIGVYFGFWFWSQTLQRLRCKCSCWALQFSLWCVRWVRLLRRPISKGDGSWNRKVLMGRQWVSTGVLPGLQTEISIFGFRSAMLLEPGRSLFLTRTEHIMVFPF